MYIINKNDVMKIAEELSKDYEMHGPIVDKGSGQVFFNRADSIAEINLNAEIPSIPPKNILFPQLETIMSYKYDAKAQRAAIEPMFNSKARALFGLRPCDLTGIQCMDRFFLGQEFVDDVYLNHRKNLFIVTNTCVTPYLNCFCVCTDSGPAAKEGYDLNLTLLGDVYLVETGSDKGKAIVEKMNLQRGDDSHLKQKSAAIDKSIDLFDKKATESKAWISRVMNRATTGFIKEETWEYIGKQCFECGACSFVCPSCTCFNIDDANISKEGSERLRTWDSCSYEGYARMAGGHNPRKPIEDRRNKRFFCKLSYSQSKKYLRPGCVGCGRCAWVCPGDIGLPNVVTYIRREIQG